MRNIGAVRFAIAPYGSEERQKSAKRIARLAYRRYAKQRDLQVVDIVFSSHQRKFLIVNITSTVERFRYLPRELI